MNRYDLKAALERERIRPYLYSIVGLTAPPKEQQYVLEEEQGKWLVYYFERGERDQLRVFESEDEACRYLLDRIVTMPWSHLRIE
ncbi:MAG: hypothetical protein QUS33_07310 [Dehalococcoidia bacterium]|nr:hypothetical protein [Dehalococcoidia bacterium]